MSKLTKRQQEDLEHLRQVDLPDSMGGGHKFIQQTEDAKAKKKKQSDDKVATYLEMEKQRKFTYRRDLASYGNNLIKDEEFDPGWEVEFVPTDGSDIKIYGKGFRTDEGIVLIVKSPKGRVFIKAFRTSMKSNIDTNAIRTLLIQAENTMDSEKGILLSDKKEVKTKSGIYLK